MVREYLQNNTVLFQSIQEGRNSWNDERDIYDPRCQWSARVCHAFIMTFSSAKYGLDTIDLMARPEDYFLYSVEVEEYAASAYYCDFLRAPSFSNPAVSFFGYSDYGTGWHQFSKPLIVPLITMVNLVRFFIEFLPYVLQVSFEHVLVQSKRGLASLHQPGANYAWYTRAAATVFCALGVLLAAVGYYVLKTARLLLRTVTAPMASYRQAARVHPLLGVVSAMLSVGAYVAASVVLTPIVLLTITKLASLKLTLLALSAAKVTAVSATGVVMLGVVLCAAAKQRARTDSALESSYDSDSPNEGDQQNVFESIFTSINSDSDAAYVAYENGSDDGVEMGLTR